MTILRSGTTKKYAEGWDKAFGRNSSKAESTAKAAKKTPKKKVAKKKVAKKKVAKKKTKAKAKKK